MGSSSPERQSIVMLPKISNLSFCFWMRSMISQSCLVILDRRETSVVMIVSPGLALSKSKESCFLFLASPCSNSTKKLSAPAAFSSRTCRSISYFPSLVEHLAYPCFIFSPHTVLRAFYGSQDGFSYQQEIVKRLLALCLVNAL